MACCPKRNFDFWQRGVFSRLRALRALPGTPGHSGHSQGLWGTPGTPRDSGALRALPGTLGDSQKDSGNIPIYRGFSGRFCPVSALFCPVAGLPEGSPRERAPESRHHQRTGQDTTPPPATTGSTPGTATTEITRSPLMTARR